MFISKKKCKNCNRKSSMKQVCVYCDGTFCINCLQQEVHDCKNLSDMKKIQIRLLSEKLKNEKCVKLKIDKI